MRVRVRRMVSRSITLAFSLNGTGLLLPPLAPYSSRFVDRALPVLARLRLRDAGAQARQQLFEIVREGRGVRRVPAAAGMGKLQPYRVQGLARDSGRPRSAVRPIAQDGV